jgi:Protein of unknown function (DUF4011)/REase_MTES_1575/AAA domain/Protein of unknown function (DUF3320)
MTRDGTDLVASRVDEWRRKLIDLSYRNRLINYKPTRASTIEIETPTLGVLLADPGRKLPWRFYFPPEEDEETDDPEDERATLFDELVVRAAAKGRPPEADEIVAANESNPKKLNRILENLARKSNSEYQDKALRILYIAAGFLDWTDPMRGEPLSSPLILVPVELKRVSASEPYQLYFVDDEEITINPSLTEKFRRDLNRDIPEDWVWEDKPVEVELDEIEQAVEGTDWTIRRDAALGLFSFQKFVMYRDLVTNEAQIAEHPIIGSLARNETILGPMGMDAQIPALPELDDVQPPELDMAILDADATQRRCVEAARRGQSFVMHGPPGTGKSQTIANVIADSIGRGQRVLFVSEKAAALDVVHGRLAAQGLDEFCLLLHGSHAARREVVESLNRSLTGELVPRPSMSSTDLDRLSKLRELLNQTAELLHLPMPQLGNRSLREVLGELARVHAAPSIPSAPEAGSSTGDAVRTELRQLEETFQRLAERWNVSPLSFAWRGYNADSFTAEERAHAVDRAEELRRATTALASAQGNAAQAIGLPVAETLKAGVGLRELLDHLGSAPSFEPRWLAVDGAERLRISTGAARSAHEQLLELERAVAQDYSARPLAEFEPGLANRLEVVVATVSDRLGRTDAWANQLVPALPGIRRFLGESDMTVRELESVGQDVAGRLGQPADGLTLARLGELASLGEMAFSAFDRPERDWLVPAGAQRADEALKDLVPLLNRYTSGREQLLSGYTEAAFELEADEVHRRFSDEYTSVLSRLGKRYRADARLIKDVRRDRKVPDSVASDLAEIHQVQKAAADIAELSGRLTVSLGSYFNGTETNLESVERAVETAARVRALAAPNTDMAVLGAAIAVSSEGDPAMAQLSNRLRETASRLSSGLELIRPFTTRSANLFDEEPIASIRTTLAKLQTEIRELGETIDDAARGATSTCDLTEITQRLKRVAEAQEATHDLALAEVGWSTELGTAYTGATSDWDRLEATATWLATLDTLLSHEELPAKLRQALIEGGLIPLSGELRQPHDSFAAAAGGLARMFEEQRQVELTDVLHEMPFPDVITYTGNLLSHVDDLHDWTEFRNARDRARAREWGPFVDVLIEREVVAREVVPAFRRAFWNRRLEALFAEDPGLADRGSTYMRWIEEFKQLDRRLVQSGTDRVIAGINKHRSVSVALSGSQTSLLRREAAKQRRHMPVRSLLAQLTTLLGELKPCLMMSPLSVSHFLTADHQFDLVIFDEASQVPPQDAINCIYRGKQLIVAGDGKQLPPTSFFQAADAEGEWTDEEPDALADMESILDVCTTILPEHPLRWHYRSRNEDLIAFSNKHVYDNLLVTFPSADSTSSQKGVHFIHVPDAVYERGPGKGFNRREAQVVARRVFEQLSAGRHSVGVITFNAAQESAVSDELDLLRFERPEYEEQFAADRLDNVFVKNLESVQGDERDVIIFSVGYGFDVDGKFLMNFGPLNNEGGHRRLNVAITRARELVEVVSSVRSSDFRLTDASKRGVRLLQEYIRYAETDGASGGAEPREPLSTAGAAIEETIGDAIEELGLTPHFDVGSGTFRVDIGVRDDDPGTPYKLAIETDGESYRAIPTARDRERLRDKVLTDLNWRVHRVWSLDWVRNRQSEIERLNGALISGVQFDPAERNKPQVRERVERKVAELWDALESGDLPWVETYRAANLRAPKTGYEFHESINRDRQRDLVVELASVEAPVHTDRVMQDLAYAYGLLRVGERVRAASLQAISMAARRGAIELREQFVWMPGQQLERVRRPDWDDPATARPIAQIPPEEISLAIEKLIETAGGMYDNLLIDVSRVLGFDRAGPRIRTAIEERLRARDQ